MWPTSSEENVAYGDYERPGVTRGGVAERETSVINGYTEHHPRGQRRIA